MRGVVRWAMTITASQFIRRTSDRTLIGHWTLGRDPHRSMNADPDATLRRRRAESFQRESSGRILVNEACRFSEGRDPGGLIFSGAFPPSGGDFSGAFPPRP